MDNKSNPQKRAQLAFVWKNLTRVTCYVKKNIINIFKGAKYSVDNFFARKYYRKKGELYANITY